MNSLRKHFIKNKKVHGPQLPQGKIKSGCTVPQHHNQTAGRKKRDEKKKLSIVRKVLKILIKSKFDGVIQQKEELHNYYV